MVIECFGIPIGDGLLEDFLEHSKHPIFELEIFPVLLALKIWQERLIGVSGGLLFGQRRGQELFDQSRRARLRLPRRCLTQFVKLEKTLKCLPWFAGVPSASNPADDASRLVFNVPWLLGVPKSPIVLPARLSQWGI